MAGRLVFLGRGLAESFCKPLLSLSSCTPQLYSCETILRAPSPLQVLAQKHLLSSWKSRSPLAFLSSVGPQEAIDFQPALYRIDVFTGDVRGAGTEVPAVVKLIGSDGVSEDFVLGNENDEFGFERGSRKTYQLEVPYDLGTLRRVHVQQLDPSASEVGTGWYLDKIEIALENGGLENRSWSFPCRSWLGKSDAGDFNGESPLAF